MGEALTRQLKHNPQLSICAVCTAPVPLADSCRFESAAVPACYRADAAPCCRPPVGRQGVHTFRSFGG